MNGRDFLDCANTLCASDRPCDLRSAVSRAYYAAYHVTVKVLDDAGARFGKNSPEGHTKMWQCLDNTNHADAQRIGRKLKSLRDDRNDADYDMADSKFEDPVNVLFRIQVAEKIIQQFDAFRAVPSEYQNLIAILKVAAKKTGIDVR